MEERKFHQAESFEQNSWDKNLIVKHGGESVLSFRCFVTAGLDHMTSPMEILKHQANLKKNYIPFVGKLKLCDHRSFHIQVNQSFVLGFVLDCPLVAISVPIRKSFWKSIMVFKRKLLQHGNQGTFIILDLCWGMGNFIENLNIFKENAGLLRAKVRKQTNRHNQPSASYIESPLKLTLHLFPWTNQKIRNTQ